MTICNGLENGYLDGKGTPQSLKYILIYYVMDSLCQEKAKNLLIFISQNLGIYIKLLKRED